MVILQNSVVKEFWSHNMMILYPNQCFDRLIDLILYVPSTIFQIYRDGSSWVEPVLS